MTKPKQAVQDEQSLVTVPQNKMLTYQEVEQIGKAFVASGMFGRDIDRVSKAITKIMAGQELGMAPFAAMRAIHVIEGNATLSANTMAAMIKRSGRYDYEVKEKSAKQCVIDYFETRGGTRRKIGTETFDEEEARAAGLLSKSNWRNYPKAMMFARCMSNGVRTYAPDVFNGMLVYTPDEMGGKVDLSGDYTGAIDGEVLEPTKPAKKEPEPAPEPETPAEGVDEAAADDIDQTPPPEVDDEFKKDVQDKLETIGLNARGNMWFMKQIDAKPYAKFDKLTDDQWRRAQTTVLAILDGELDIDDSHIAGFVENVETPVDTTVPTNQDDKDAADLAQPVLDVFEGAEVLDDKNKKDDKAVPAND